MRQVSWRHSGRNCSQTERAFLKQCKQVSRNPFNKIGQTYKAKKPSAELAKMTEEIDHLLGGFDMDEARHHSVPDIKLGHFLKTFGGVKKKNSK